MLRLQKRASLLLLVFLLLPDKPFAGLSGSSHDFSKKNWSGGEICLPCHNAHGQGSVENAAPLWNRATGTTSYRIYSSSTFNADIAQPGGVSKLCLSCHDGISAIDSFGGVNGSVLISGDARLGNDPGDHHPVSFVYDSALAQKDGDLHDPTTAPSGLGGTIAEKLLVNGRVECTSCHDVHNSNEFLRFINTGGGVDGLCSTCHVSGRQRVNSSGQALSLARTP